MKKAYGAPLELFTKKVSRGGKLFPMMNMVRCAVTLPFLLAVATGSAQTVDVPAGQKIVVTVEGRGSQIYKCDHAGDAVKWVFVAPEAQLFLQDALVGTHGAGPMWTAMGGSVHGRVLQSLDSPDATSVPWLLLQATTSEGAGPMRTVTYIQRTATNGGKAPAAGCDTEHVGATLRVPYTATYTFYAPTGL